MEGRNFSHYEVVERLGGGGMGVVYKALDTKLNRHVALKFLPHELTRDDEARARFIQEAQAASALDHPNICTIHEVDSTPEGQMFIAMAFYDGSTLKKLIDGGPLPVEQAVDIAVQIAQGLTKAHSAGIVHRDIKPANVMVTKDGFVKIVDFGIAKLLGQTGPTQSGSTLGTVSYMSPEQVAGDDADPRSDVWALGALLYEMLTGRVPFPGENQWAIMNSIANRELASARASRPEIPAQVEAAVMAALEKVPEDRTGSAEEFRRALQPTHVGAGQPLASVGAASTWRSRLRTREMVMAGAAVVLLLGMTSAWFYGNGAEVRWAREEALPEIQRLIDAERVFEAFDLAARAEERIPGDLALADLWTDVSIAGSVVTEPEDASVSYRPYGAADDAWRYLGQSPLEEVRLPRGVFEWRVEREGYEPRIWAAANPSRLLHNLRGGDGIAIPLQTEDDTPVGMVEVPSVRAPVSITGFNSGEPVEVGAFAVDRYEVTNREFKEFVDAGGYTDPTYWERLEFVREGRALTWDEAVRSFVDATGRPGPATWELGDYPDGQGDYPVGGVSWYEAMAYARFAGKSLPTVYHFAVAALAPAEIVSPIGPAIVPRSNFENGSPVPVGTSGSMGPYGTHDTAGNVREWCSNASGDLRWILGGGYSDPSRMFSIRLALPPFDRSPLNGFRTVSYREEIPADLLAPVDYASRDYADAEAVSDEVFEFFARQLAYEPIDPGPTVVETATADDWTVERVSLNAGYDGDRVPVLVYLPVDGSPPYQSVILFPGLGSFQNRGSSEGLMDGPGTLDYIVKSGRAVIQPVWNGSFERWDSFLGLSGEEYQRTFRERVGQWRQEIGVTIDYLTSRVDFDENAIAYWGSSFGGSTPLALLAVEERLRAAVLRSGGFPYRAIPQEVDPVNFVGRVRLPVLMVNGRYDYVFALETAQRPLYERFGSSPGEKRHVILDAGHFPLPRGPLIQESLAWLDEYLGPVD